MQNNSYYENVIIFEWVGKWFYNNCFSNKSCFNLKSSGFQLMHSDGLQELH